MYALGVSLLSLHPRFSNRCQPFYIERSMFLHILLAVDRVVSGFESICAENPEDILRDQSAI